MLCQWAHTYDISDADLRSIVATFLSVFPDGTLWLVGEADVLLIGSTEPLTDRVAGIAAAWQRPGVADDLASVGATAPLSVLSLFISEGPALQAWTAGAPHPDRQPGAPRVLGAAKHLRVGSRRQRQRRCCNWPPTSPRNPAVARALAAATADDWAALGAMFLKSDGYAPAYAYFQQAIELNPRSPGGPRRVDAIVACHWAAPPRRATC